MHATESDHAFDFDVLVSSINQYQIIFNAQILKIKNYRLRWFGQSDCGGGGGGGWWRTLLSLALCLTYFLSLPAEFGFFFFFP